MTFDRSVLDRFDADADVPARAIDGLAQNDLLWRPDPEDAKTLGSWSIQQLVMHLMDSHVIAVYRMRRIVAEARPLLIGYDENAFVRNLFYESADVRAAAEIFRLTQRMTAWMLRQLPDEAFERAGIHNEAGEITIASLLPSYIRHLDHHMTFLRAKRAALGKPLAW